jgi:hypothetical protein
MTLLSIVWHKVRGYEFIPADVINAESGSMDDYCRCLLCKVKQLVLHGDL